MKRHTVKTKKRVTAKRKTVGRKAPEKAAKKVPDTVTFRANIPGVETAIKVHGEGGARMLLDVAEEDLAGFLPAVRFRSKMLLVTLTEDESIDVDDLPAEGDE